MQNKLVFLAVLTSFGLVLDWFFEKPVTTTLGRSLSGPGTIPRLPKAVQSGFLPKKAKKPDWTGLLNSNWGRNYQCRNYCILHILEVCAISVYATGVYPSIIYHHCRYCLYLLQMQIPVILVVGSTYQQYVVYNCSIYFSNQAQQYLQTLVYYIYWQYILLLHQCIYISDTVLVVLTPNICIGSSIHRMHILCRSTLQWTACMQHAHCQYNMRCSCG